MMTDRQKVAAWSGMRIPTNQLRLKNALEVIREALIDVERMGAVARDMEPPFYTRGNLPLGTDLCVAACDLGGALERLGRAISSLDNCCELSDLDRNPV
jgi:hypothetical protein